MKDKYAGMTVNERLYASGFIEEFYAATKEKNIEKTRSILKKVGLDSDSITSILKELDIIE